MSQQKWKAFHNRVDARFSELNYDPMLDCPKSSYDRFFLNKGLLVIVDLPVQMPNGAQLCNDGEAISGKLFDQNKRVAFVFYQSKAINKWMRENGGEK